MMSKLPYRRGQPDRGVDVDPRLLLIHPRRDCDDVGVGEDCDAKHLTLRRDFGCEHRHRIEHVVRNSLVGAKPDGEIEATPKKPDQRRSQAFNPRHGRREPPPLSGRMHVCQLNSKGDHRVRVVVWVRLGTPLSTGATRSQCVLRQQ